MFISKSLAKKLRHPASVLLRDGVDKDGIQPLILNDYFWRSKMPYNDWPDFLRQAAEKLLASRADTDPRITASKLTTTNYWFCDKWYGNRLSFVRLRDAKKAAREQIGESVTIFSNKTGNIVCFASASGYCPP